MSTGSGNVVEALEKSRAYPHRIEEKLARGEPPEKNFAKRVLWARTPPGGGVATKIRDIGNFARARGYRRCESAVLRHSRPTCAAWASDAPEITSHEPPRRPPSRPTTGRDVPDLQRSRSSMRTQLTLYLCRNAFSSV